MLLLFLLRDDELTTVGGDSVRSLPTWGGLQDNFVGVGLRKVDVAVGVVLDALEVAEVERVGLRGLVVVVDFFNAASRNGKNGQKGDKHKC